MWHKRAFLPLGGGHLPHLVLWAPQLDAGVASIPELIMAVRVLFPVSQPFMFLPSTCVKVRVWRGGGGGVGVGPWHPLTPAPFDPVSAFNLRGGMRGFLRPEEAAVGGGSYDAQRGCHPASRRLSNFTFSRNGVRRRLRAGLVLREAVSVCF